MSVVDFTAERARRLPPELVPPAVVQILDILENLAPAEIGQILAHVFAATDEATQNQTVRTLHDIAEMRMAQALGETGGAA